MAKYLFKTPDSEQSADLADKLKTPPQRISEGAIEYTENAVPPGRFALTQQPQSLTPENPESRTAEYIKRTRYDPIENAFGKNKKNNW
jgi:hypothetical protein